MSKNPAFMDTNVILRHVLQDLPEHSVRASELIARVEAGEERVLASETVVFEAVYVLTNFYRIPRSEVAQNLIPLISMPGIELPGRVDILRAFDLWVERPGLSFADCFHIFSARRYSSGRIYSFDRKVGAVAGISRLET